MSKESPQDSLGLFNHLVTSNFYYILHIPLKGNFASLNNSWSSHNKMKALEIVLNQQIKGDKHTFLEFRLTEVSALCHM